MIAGLGAGITSFNSTLVRLKVTRLRQRLTSTQLFQFHTGSIEGRSACAKRSLRKPRFNSTLVRLKVLIQSPIAYSPKTFQFHTGSIEGDQPDSGEAWRNVVSIPHWFD